VHEGWGQLTKQLDEDGSSRSLILSLRLDHGLLLPPHQLARLENNLPACTVGSLQPRTRMDCLLAFIRELIVEDNPGEQFNRLSQAVEEVCQLAPSKKTPEQQTSWEARANTHLEISGGDGVGQCRKDRTLPCSLRRLP
jgi:hypothetical protein